MPEAATGRRSSKSRRELPKDAESSRMHNPHLDGPEPIRQLWKAHPCEEAAPKSPGGDQAVAPPTGAMRPGTEGEAEGRGGDFPTDLFTREDLERVIMALGRCWSVEK